ncbi:MAG: TraB/GumN family protein [Thermonemataceae bacterium]|nr:TraB/GumN family protein [Thermonemataceae bacterium]
MKYLVSTLFLFIIQQVLFAQSKGEVAKNNKGELRLDNSVFWEISGKGLKKPSYLFGTHHLYPTEKMKKNEFVQGKIKETEVVVGEIALDNMLAASFVMMKYSMMEDTTLLDLLGEKKYKEIDAYMQKNMQMGIAMFNRMRPIILVQMISMKKASQDLNLPESTNGDIGNSLDGYFQQYGKSLNKKVVGLETIDYQANVLLKGYTLQRQAEMLIEAIEDKGTQSADMYQKLNKFYQEQNLNELATLALEGDVMQKSEYDALLKKRNDAWMPQIEQLIHEKPTFIAVGALHLVGVDGLIYQLRKKGYTVKPLKITM